MNSRLSSNVLLKGRLFNAFSKIGFRIPKKAKTYHYCETGSGEAFVLEPLKDQAGLFAMTSQRFGIKQHDFILIQGESGDQLYKILEIESYCGEYMDLWIAKLSLVANR
jgi:hypothetical protein